MATRIQLRRGTAEQWRQVNPVLYVGEAGFETDTGILRIGDGETPFTSLRPTYANGKTDVFTLLAENWQLTDYEDVETGEITTGLPYYQTIAVDLMTSEFNPHVNLISEPNDFDDAILAIKEYSKIFSGESSDGEVTFYAFEAPTVDLNIRIKRL